VDDAAIDLHKKESQIRMVTTDGEGLDTRVPTTRAALTGVWAGRARTRILVEASTESEWVAQHLEGLGHQVLVADPNYLLMYGMRDRRIKTDVRGVAALVEACRRGIYRPVHRRSAAQREVQAHLVRTPDSCAPARSIPPRLIETLDVHAAVGCAEQVRQLLA
jgi:transposase